MVIDLLLILGEAEVRELIPLKPKASAQVAGSQVDVQERKVLALWKNNSLVLVKTNEIVDVEPASIHLDNHLLLGRGVGFALVQSLWTGQIYIDRPSLFELVPVHVQLEIDVSGGLAFGVMLQCEYRHGVQCDTFLIVRYEKPE